MQMQKVPITLLSGFLGAGKTTLLRQALENNQGLKIAVVVNDVASINIDAKLVRERTSAGAGGDDGLADSIELQNGCACCNASDELLQGISQLLRMAHRCGTQYDRLIIELSGVAEPKNIRREFADAAESGHFALQICELQTMITVVDSPHFFDLFSSKDAILNRPDLCAENAADAEAVDSERKVVDLLVEQIECADFIILNKKDKAEADKMETLAGIVSTINPTATVLSSEWGKVPLDTVMGPPKSSSWVCKADDEDDLRESLAAAKQQIKKRKMPEAEAAQQHAHTHAQNGHAADCDEPHGSGHGGGHEADGGHEHGGHTEHAAHAAGHQGAHEGGGHDSHGGGNKSRPTTAAVQKKKGRHHLIYSSIRTRIQQ